MGSLEAMTKGSESRYYGDTQTLKIAQGVSGTVRDKGSIRRTVPFMIQAVKQGFQDLGAKDMNQVRRALRGEEGWGWGPREKGCVCVCVVVCVCSLDCRGLKGMLLLLAGSRSALQRRDEDGGPDPGGPGRGRRARHAHVREKALVITSSRYPFYFVLGKELEPRPSAAWGLGCSVKFHLLFFCTLERHAEPQ
jgi:hypothetical protein